MHRQPARYERWNKASNDKGVKERGTRKYDENEENEWTSVQREENYYWRAQNQQGSVINFN